MSCTISLNNYTDYYIEKYNPGKLGIQPHTFVIKDGKQIKVESFRLWNPSPNNNFEWLPSQLNYTIEPERSYKSIEAEGSTFVFKTIGVDVSIILRRDFIKPMQMEITAAFCAPYETQRVTKTIKFETGIFSTQ